ncbi:MAG: hypothetical protein ACFE9Z_08695 [Promethearchaeota archaeon]
MAKIIISCRKCGKNIRIDFNTSSLICKKCRKNIPEKVEKTTRFFDF